VKEQQFGLLRNNTYLTIYRKMFIPTQKAQLFCLLPAKELYELFCLVFFLIRKQEKLDKKPGKMKQENNNHSEI